MDFVCFQGTDKKNWPQINALIKKGAWEKVFIIKDSSVENIALPNNAKTIAVNTELSLVDLKDEILEKLSPQISREFEVALSIASGSGKESMALISALLSIPVGIRLVAFTKQGVQFIS